MNRTSAVLAAALALCLCSAFAQPSEHPIVNIYDIDESFFEPFKA